jgi:predicted Zn-dependent peptidase
MTSCLFQLLREDEALVYHIDASDNLFSDNGYWQIQAGFNPQNEARVKVLIQQELNALIQKPLTPEALELVKTQLKGSIYLGMDSGGQWLHDAAQHYLYHQNLLDYNSWLTQIDQVEVETLQALAGRYFAADTLTMVSVGPKPDALVE